MKSCCKCKLFYTSVFSVFLQNAFNYSDWSKNALRIVTIFSDCIGIELNVLLHFLWWGAIA